LNFSRGTKKGQNIPKEPWEAGVCTEFKVCPAQKKECCGEKINCEKCGKETTKPPKAPWDYSGTPQGPTCNNWTDMCVAGGVEQ
jgi:hypothetical protein